MTAEADLLRDTEVIPKTTPAAGFASGEVIQLADGRAAFVTGLNARVSGDPAGLKTSGQVTLAKTAALVILEGGRVYWDRSAGTATPLQASAGGDFFVGVAIEDAASAATTVVVDLNVQPKYLVDLQRDAGNTVIVLTAGTPFCYSRGGSLLMEFSETAEAQKVDWLSEKSVPVTVPMIFEAKFELTAVADADVMDFSIGLANGTHATDAETITESAFFHMDGTAADLNIDAECDDGTAAEVAITDTTVDLVLATPIEMWIDARVLTDLKYYVNGVRVLSTTAFDIGDATGPLKALAHLEKTSNDSPGAWMISHMAIRATDLAS